MIKVKRETLHARADFLECEPCFANRSEVFEEVNKKVSKGELLVICCDTQ